MARRTKEDALETRNRILDAAERVFERRGVSRTTLNEIGVEAGVSRGAIYWHFEDKAEVFDAMMLRVMLPLEESFQAPESATSPTDALVGLRRKIQHSLRRILEDERIRRVFEIALHKVEYVDELEKVRMRRIEGCQKHTQRICDALQAAMDAGLLRQGVSAQTAAIGLHAMIDGLLQTWVLDREAFDLEACGATLIDVFLNGLRQPLSEPSR